MVNRWEIVITLLIIINLLDFVWITNIKYKRTIGRRKRWKRQLSILFFIIAPFAFVVNLLSWPYSAWWNVLLGGLGVWFSISQINFVHKHSGVPQIVEPISTFYFLLCGLLLAIGAMGII